jgi:hypothetical protein
MLIFGERKRKNDPKIFIYNISDLKSPEEMDSKKIHDDTIFCIQLSKNNDFCVSGGGVNDKKCIISYLSEEFKIKETKELLGHSH